MAGSATLRGALLLIGFTSVTAQVVLMRELIVTFYGNEISIGVMLACWLLWTAVGSGVLDRISLKVNSRTTLGVLELAVAAGFPAALLIVRESKGFFQVAQGQVLGLGPMFAAAFVALGVFCPFSGWLFSAGSRALQRETSTPMSQATTSVYMFEALGSAAGGLIASVVLVRWLQPFEIAAVLACLNLMAAAALLTGRWWMALAAVPLLILGARSLESTTLSRFWKGFRLLAVRNSVYGNLAVLETEGSRSLAENGLIVTTVPDPSAAEESVHLPLLEHPRPERVLLVGGGANGSIPEVLKHPSVHRIDYVELDPTIPSLARHFFPNTIPADCRVVVHAEDGRRFVKRTPDLFDVVVVSLPEPQTAQLNRFYTEEFLREAASRLRDPGLLAVAFPSSETYISPQAAAFLRCMRRTFETVFPQVAALPGETVHIFGSNAPLVTDAGTLIERLRDRGVRTQYVSEHFLPFRLAPERVRELSALLAPNANTPVNRDLAPIAYYFDQTLWSARFGTFQRDMLEGAARVPFAAVAAGLVFALLVFSVLLRPSPAAFCAGITGFTILGIEVMLLIGFQALYGYVYHQLALVVGAFMAGLASGAWLAGRHKRGLSLWAIQAVVAIAPLAVFVLQQQGAAAVIALAILGGILGGYQFGMASRRYFEDPAVRPGALYACDLAGSCVGALGVSAYAIPIFGFFRTALLIAFVNVIPTLAAFGRRTLPR
jgi:spermidine synthase